MLESTYCTAPRGEKVVSRIPRSLPPPARTQESGAGGGAESVTPWIGPLCGVVHLSIFSLIGGRAPNTHKTTTSPTLARELLLLYLNGTSKQGIYTHIPEYMFGNAIAVRQGVSHAAPGDRVGKEPN